MRTATAVDVELRYKNSVGYGHIKRAPRFYASRAGSVVIYRGKKYDLKDATGRGRYYIELTEPLGPEAFRD